MPVEKKVIRGETNNTLKSISFFIDPPKSLSRLPSPERTPLLGTLYGQTSKKAKLIKIVMEVAKSDLEKVGYLIQVINSFQTRTEKTDNEVYSFSQSKDGYQFTATEKNNNFSMLLELLTENNFITIDKKVSQELKVRYDLDVCPNSGSDYSPTSYS